MPEWPVKFSTLESVASTPLSSTLLDKGLRQKNADIKFFSDVAHACLEEGSNRFQTQCLADSSRESRLHHRLQKDLPAVRAVMVTTLRNKKQTTRRKLSP